MTMAGRSKIWRFSSQADGSSRKSVRQSGQRSKAMEWVMSGAGLASGFLGPQGFCFALQAVAGGRFAVVGAVGQHLGAIHTQDFCLSFVKYLNRYHPTCVSCV
jgi:hypothetical protein